MEASLVAPMWKVAAREASNFTHLMCLRHRPKASTTLSTNVTVFTEYHHVIMSSRAIKPSTLKLCGALPAVCDCERRNP